MPTTIQELIERLSNELQTTETEVQNLTLTLGQKRERAAFLQGQIAAYRSIQLVEQNPAEIEHGSEEV